MAKNDRLSMCRAESVFAAVRWANLVLIGYGAALQVSYLWVRRQVEIAAL